MCENGPETANRRLAERQCKTMDYRLRALVYEIGRLPNDTEVARLRLEANVPATDPWGELYRYDAIAKAHFKSAGPDRLFDTPNDITEDSLTLACSERLPLR